MNPAFVAKSNTVLQSYLKDDFSPLPS